MLALSRSLETLNKILAYQSLKLAGQPEHGCPARHHCHAENSCLHSVVPRHVTAGATLTSSMSGFGFSTFLALFYSLGFGTLEAGILATVFLLPLASPKTVSALWPALEEMLYCFDFPSSSRVPGFADMG